MKNVFFYNISRAHLNVRLKVVLCSESCADGDKKGWVMALSFTEDSRSAGGTVMSM